MIVSVRHRVRTTVKGGTPVGAPPFGVKRSARPQYALLTLSIEPYLSAA